MARSNDHYQRGSGAAYPPRKAHCASCMVYRTIDSMVLEDGPQSPFYNQYVCPDGCYDGPYDIPLIIPEADVPDPDIYIEW